MNSSNIQPSNTPPVAPSLDDDGLERDEPDPGPMPGPLPETPLDPETCLKDRALLPRIQGNILNPHGRDFTRLILFRFYGNGSKLRKLFPAAVKQGLVTNAERQWLDAMSRKCAQPDASPERRRFARREKLRPMPQPFYSVALSSWGMRRCGYSDADIPAPDTDGFWSSMNKVFEALGDHRAGRRNKPVWEGPYGRYPHGMWLLAHETRSELDVMQGKVVALLNAHQARPIGVEDGRRWRDRHNPKMSREPFGFLDGISQPEFFKGEAYDRTPWWIKIPRKQVLIDESIPEHGDGSFIVLRKLAQNVKAFRAFEAEVRPEMDRLTLPPEHRPKDPGALLVGRERDGTPLISKPVGPHGLNDFEFDVSADRCPFHAHIRKANPRTREKGVDEMTRRRAAQFVRRSVVYDRDGQLPEFATADYAAGDAIEQGVGLLFMAYMSSISPFVIQQRNWFAAANFPVDNTDFGDPLLRPLATGRDALWRWREQPSITARALPEFVQPRGGAYFYVPPMAWLRSPPRARPPTRT